MRISISLIGFWCAAAAYLLVGVAFAEARTVVRSGESVSIPEEQSIEGDFYSAASKIHLSGKVEEDMVAAGGQITINGEVGDNAFLLGGTTDVHGVIGDDLRIISGEVTIAEPVMGDLLVIGGALTVLSTASIAGDILLFVGEATIEGSVGGDVLGTVSSLRVDAPVAGDIDVVVNELVLGSRAAVQGSVSYTSNQLVTQALEATIEGELVRNDPVIPGNQPNIYAAVIPLFILLFSVLVWFLISRRSLNAVLSRAVVKSPRPLLLGILAVLFVPLAALILFTSMIGMLVGIVLVALYLLLAALSITGMAAVLGQLLLTAFNQPAQHTSLVSLVMGVIVIGLLMLLPILGQVVLSVLFLITFGAMVDLLVRPTMVKITEE